LTFFDWTFVKTKESRKQKATLAAENIYLPTAHTIEDLIKDDPVQSLDEAFTRKLQEFNPDLIAVSSITSYIDRVVDPLREANYSCPVILGGVLWPLIKKAEPDTPEAHSLRTELEKGLEE